MGKRKSAEKNEFYSPMKRIMLTIMGAGIAGCLAFGALCGRYGVRWAMPLAVTCGMFAYHMAIRFAAPGFLTAFSHKRYDCRSAWFQPRPWEDRLYRFLKVKRWKGRALTYDPREFSLKVHTPEEIINNMCHAELTHELIVLLSFTSLLFAIPFGSFPAFLVTALLAAAFDSTFIIIQRYNRPRLMKLLGNYSGRSAHLLR